MQLQAKGMPTASHRAVRQSARLGHHTAAPVRGPRGAAHRSGRPIAPAGTECATGRPSAQPPATAGRSPDSSHRAGRPARYAPARDVDCRRVDSSSRLFSCAVNTMRFSFAPHRIAPHRVASHRTRNTACLCISSAHKPSLNYRLKPLAPHRGFIAVVVALIALMRQQIQSDIDEPLPLITSQSARLEGIPNSNREVKLNHRVCITSAPRTCRPRFFSIHVHSPVSLPRSANDSVQLQSPSRIDSARVISATSGSPLRSRLSDASKSGSEDSIAIATRTHFAISRSFPLITSSSPKRTCNRTVCQVIC